MAEGLRGALGSLKTAVGDLSSLEVQTYTGTISVEADGKIGGIEKVLKGPCHWWQSQK